MSAGTQLPLAGVEHTAATITLRSGARFRAERWALVGDTVVATGRFADGGSASITRAWPCAMVESVRWRAGRSS